MHACRATAAARWLSLTGGLKRIRTRLKSNMSAIRVDTLMSRTIDEIVLSSPQIRFVRLHVSRYMNRCTSCSRPPSRSSISLFARYRVCLRFNANIYARHFFVGHRISAEMSRSLDAWIDAECGYVALRPSTHFDTCLSIHSQMPRFIIIRPGI